MSKCLKLEKELCLPPECIWVDKKRKYCRIKVTKRQSKTKSKTKSKKMGREHTYAGWEQGLAKILVYNNNTAAKYNGKNNTIHLTSTNGTTILELGRNIGSGTYNSIYDINDGNVLSISKYNPSSYTKMEWMDNFIYSSTIHQVLSQDTNYKCVPNIDTFFFMLNYNKELVSLSKITQKLDMDGFYYFSRYRTEKEWLNYLVQLADKLKYLQQVYQFNHRDLKIDNTMLKELSTPSIINYKSTNYDFNLTNLGIEWFYIDFGFSCLTTPNGIEYKSSEYFNQHELCFRPDRDLSQLFFYCLSFVSNIPPTIKSFFIETLININYRNTQINCLPSETIENKNDEWFAIYDIFNDSTFSNINGTPEMVLQNLSKLVK